MSETEATLNLLKHLEIVLTMSILDNESPDTIETIRDQIRALREG